MRAWVSSRAWRKRVGVAKPKQQEDYSRSAISASENQFRLQPTWSNRQGATDSSTPATLVGCVKGFAFTGTLLLMAYAYFGLHMVACGQLATWGVKGAIAGAAAGVAAYAVIVILRIAMAILAVALKVAFFVAVVVGGLYLLTSAL